MENLKHFKTTTGSADSPCTYNPWKQRIVKSELELILLSVKLTK